MEAEIEQAMEAVRAMPEWLVKDLISDTLLRDHVSHARAEDRVVASVWLSSLTDSVQEGDALAEAAFGRVIAGTAGAASKLSCATCGAPIASLFDGALGFVRIAVGRDPGSNIIGGVLCPPCFCRPGAAAAAVEAVVGKVDVLTIRPTLAPEARA